MAKAVAKIDKTKYETILIFGDFLEPRAYKEYNTYLVGRKILQGHGAGNNLEQGRFAFEESKKEILDLIHNDYVIVVCGLSRGMSGGLVALVKELMDNGKKVFTIVTCPLIFEGPEAYKKYHIVINELKKITNDYFVSNGQELLDSLPNATSILDFFKEWDNVIYSKILEIISNYESNSHKA